MGLGSGELSPIAKELIEGDFVPAKNLVWVQVIDYCQCVELVQCGNDFMVLDIREPADV
jgi:hypothetical protein